MRLPFIAADDITFKEALEATRPGLKNNLPLSSRNLAGRFLDSACYQVEDHLKTNLRGKICVISQDGWSNINSEPIIATTLLSGGESYPHDFVATGSNQKTAEYCFALLKESILSAEKSYGVKVVGFVSDNENKMKKVREVSIENRLVIN